MASMLHPCHAGLETHDAPSCGMQPAHPRPELSSSTSCPLARWDCRGKRRPAIPSISATSGLEDEGEDSSGWNRISGSRYPRRRISAATDRECCARRDRSRCATSTLVVWIRPRASSGQSAAVQRFPAASRRQGRRCGLHRIARPLARAAHHHVLRGRQGRLLRKARLQHRSRKEGQWSMPPSATAASSRSARKAARNSPRGRPTTTSRRDASGASARSSVLALCVSGGRLDARRAASAGAGLRDVGGPGALAALQPQAHARSVPLDDRLRRRPDPRPWART
jgi:hypothetical protein